MTDDKEERIRRAYHRVISTEQYNNLVSGHYVSWGILEELPLALKPQHTDEEWKDQLRELHLELDKLKEELARLHNQQQEEREQFVKRIKSLQDARLPDCLMMQGIAYKRVDPK